MTELRKIAGTGALLLILLLWGLHLGYPMQRLQHIRWAFAGYVFPVYYVFVVSSMVGAAAAVLSFKRHWVKWELLWWLLPLICIPGILHSGDRIWSLRQWFSWVVRGIIPGGIIFLIANRKKQEFALLYWVYPIIIASSVLGLAEIYYDYNPIWDNSSNPPLQTAQPNNPFYRPFYSDYSVLVSDRPRGTQGNRIPYSATIVAFLPLGIWLLRYKKEFFFLNFLVVNILVAILLIGQARSVWIGAVAGILLMFAVNFRQNWKRLLIVIACMSAWLCIFLAWPKTYTMFWYRYKTLDFVASSVRSRLQVLETAKVLKVEWPFGVGFGQFPMACKSYYHSVIPWTGTPDNQYLRWVIENGVLSFILLLAFFAGLIWAGWQKVQAIKDIQQAEFYKALLVGWLSMAVTFFFFDGFYWGACNMTFWSLLGLFATCLKPPSESY